LIKKFLENYGRHFWILSLLVTLLSLYLFIESNGEFYIVLIFSALTFYFYLKGTGKLKEEDDPFIE